MRLILYTGKGGVGKSSLAAASAVRAAELGHSTLLVSSDLAHNLTVAETRRAFAYFRLFGFPVDGVFVNKVFPQSLAHGFLREWYTLQQDLLKSIDQSFLEVAKFRVPLLGREPIGVEALAELARPLFDQKTPEQILSESRPVHLTRQGKGYELTFLLPELAKRDLDARCKDQELILVAGNYTRVFSLPDTLTGREIQEATFANGNLTIRFQ